MKQLKIILGNVKKDALNNIIMIVFVTFSVFLMDISLSEFMHQEYINGLVRDCGLYDDYMFVHWPMKWGNSDNWLEKEEQTMAYIETELDKMTAEGTAENWSRIASLGDYMFYSSELAHSIRFPVSKGIWFDKYDFGGNSDGNLTPIVVGSNYAHQNKVGDIVTFDIIKGECLVIGVLERNVLVLSPGGYGSDMDLEMCFEASDDLIILADGETIEKYSPYFGGAAVKTSPENQQRVLDEFGDISGAFTFRQMADNSYEENSTLTEMQSIIFVLMSVVCVTGVSSINLLATIASKKKYAVYFLCGMNWKTGVITTLSESVLKLAIPGAVGYAMFRRWCAEHYYMQLRVTSVNVIVTVVFLVLIFLLTSLMPLLDIRRTSPVKIIVDT